MKKILLTAFLFFAVLIYASAQEQSDKSTEISYVNIPVYKVYDHADVYQVMYYRAGMHTVGKMMLPKKWFMPEGMKKGVVRNLSKNLGPYVTIVYKGGNFNNVILNMPADRQDSSWSFLPPGTVIDDDIKNADTLSFKL